MSLSFGIYKKQLIFFLALFLISGGIFYLIQGQFSSASVTEIAPPSQSGSYDIDLKISKNGQTKINDRTVKRILSMGKEYDELRYIAVEKEGIYINQLNIYIHFPESVNQNEIKQKIYAIHGVGTSRYYWKDSQTLIYNVYNLQPSATLTIVVWLPKGIIDFPWTSKVIYNMINIPSWLWLAISIIMPLIALLILLMMFRQTYIDWRTPKPKDMINKPPSPLSPAEVGVLVEGKMSARLLAAILLDLACHDYLQIVNKGKDYTFGQKKPLDLSLKEPDMKLFEKILLTKIFTTKDIKSTVGDIQVRIGRHVFSRKIAEVYLEIYESITKGGYFWQNPSVMHTHFRATGLTLFFIGLVGFTIGIFLKIDPKFYLLFWTGMIFTSLVIIKMSPHLPIRTAKGQKEVYQWLRFKNFLIDPTPIGYIEGVQQLFEKYLPHAIALRCETEWTKRFMEHPFHQPSWYASSKSVVILEDFIESLFPIVGFISKELAASREPIV